MKKIIGFLLSVLMTGNLICCQGVAANKEAKTLKAQETLAGAYQQPESPEITEEIKAICDKAFEDLLGATYEPVALLGTQVVAGTNYCILFICTPVVPDAEGTYTIGYLYEDLQGNVECTDLVDSSVSTELNDGMGSFTQPGSPEITEEVKAVFEKAMEKKTKEEIETEYTPIALLSTQVVAGTNYRILCTASNEEKEEEEEETYVMLTIYEDLSGNAEVIDKEEIPAEET